MTASINYIHGKAFGEKNRSKTKFKVRIQERNTIQVITTASWQIHAFLHLYHYDRWEETPWTCTSLLLISIRQAKKREVERYPNPNLRILYTTELFPAKTVPNIIEAEKNATKRSTADSTSDLETNGKERKEKEDYNLQMSRSTLIHYTRIPPQLYRTTDKSDPSELRRS
ncbi:unnamed protein product [Caenorhabditis nigoni]